MNFRIAEGYEDPANKTDASIEAESAAGSPPLCHGEEGGRDDDVAHPQQVTLLIMVPSARTSRGRISVPTQEMGATPAAKKDTYRIIDTT